MAGLATSGALAQEAFLTGNADIGYGHEQMTSPLIQVTDNGALVRVDGINRLAGSIQTFAVSATGGVRGVQGVDLLVGVSLRDKSSKQAPDLGFRLFSVDPMINIPVAGGGLSNGFSLQKIDVAGKPFRSRTVWHTDWTSGRKGQGYSSYVLEYADNRHAEDFRDLDSRSGMLLAHHRVAVDDLPFSHVSVEFGGIREENAHGWRDLSNRVLFGRLSVDGKTGPLQWGGHWMHLRSRYDEGASATQPARRDRFDLYELTVAYPFSEAVEARVELTSGYNAANSAQFESRMKAAMIVLEYSY